MVDPQLVSEIAGTSGIGTEIVEKVLSMMTALRSISEDPLLGKRFALIGGTAINLFNRAMPRLSVDIDIDYFETKTGPIGHDAVQEHSDILHRIAMELEMNCQEDRPKNHFTLTYKSNFLPEGHGDIKIDISYLLKCTIFPPNKRKFLQLHPDDGFQNVRVLMADPAEIWAGKALALIYRSQNDPKRKERPDLYSMFIARHLFDVSLMEEKLQRKSDVLNLKNLRIAFIIKGVPRIKDLFHLRGENLKNCSTKELNSQLYPYLLQKPTRSLEEMKMLAREFLDRVCSNNWSKNQKKFAKSFQRGKYKPELLFGANNPKFTRLYHNEYLHQSAKSSAQKTGR